MSQPQKINVIEYKGKLFRTQEEYDAFKKKEIRDLAVLITGSHEVLIALLQHLTDNAVNTKTKLENLTKEVIDELESFKEEDIVCSGESENSEDEED